MIETHEQVPSIDEIRAGWLLYIEEAFYSWNPGQTWDRDTAVAAFNRGIATHDAAIRAALATRDEGSDTPTEEEARHDFASLVDWRYDERRAEFNRMLDVRDEAMRAHCAAMVRSLAEDMRNSVGWDEEWSTREVRDALGIAADKIDGTRE